jgi:DNA-binding NtrC family response regulator
MARVLLTTMQVSSANDELLRPLIDAGHELVLRTHAWLGNVRELKNVLESALVMSDGAEVKPEHIRLRKRATVAVTGDVILANGNASPARSVHPAGPGRSDGGTASDHGNGNGNGRGHGTNGNEGAGAMTGGPGGVVWLGEPGTPVGHEGNGKESLVRVPPGGVTLEKVERALLEATLELASGNRSAAARMLGISRPTVIRKIKQYGLRSKSQS